MDQLNNKIVWDLEICKNIDLLKEADRIILYGAGGKGKEIYKWFKDADISVNYFCDMDIKKWETYIEDVRVISPFMLSKLEISENNRTFIIACIPYPQELCELLKQLDLLYMRVISYFGIKMALQINAEYILGKGSKRVAFLKVENALRKNYFLNGGIDFLRNLLAVTDETIWVLQPGKTASSSLAARLREANLPYIGGHLLEYPEYLIGEEHRNIWERCIQERKDTMKVIVAVREPLSRDYSAFWQAFTEGAERSLLMPILNGDFEYMYHDFLDFIMKGSTYAKEKLGFSMPYVWRDQFRWFDEQIKTYLDIDVFQYPFDKEKGYTIIKKEKIEIFLFKVEKMEDILEEISGFAGAIKMPKTNKNVAKQKWYSLAYSQFRREIQLPIEYVNHYYQGNPRVDYFYTQKEKDDFLKRWEKNIIC